MARKVVPVSFGLEPAYSALESLGGLACADQISGLGEWVEQTARSLPPDVAHRHKLIFNALEYGLYDLIPDKNYPSFLSYVDMVADLDPYELRDRMIEKLRQIAFDWSEPGTVVPDAPP